MKKQIILGITSMVLVSAIAVGGTLAFLSAKTNEMTNTFTAVGSDISGQLREPAWDGYDFGANNPDGKTANPIKADGEPRNQAELDALGVNMAKEMYPTMEIPKNPMLKNTSSIPVWMAMKVTYTNKAKFDAIANPLAINTDAWKLVSSGADYDIYIYATSYTPAAEGTAETGSFTTVGKLGSGHETTVTPLFDKVTIKDVDSTVFSGNFAITLKGSAVQTKNISFTAAKQALIDQLNAA